MIWEQFLFLLRAAIRENRFLRFLLVGAGNTAFGYGVFALLYACTGLHRLAIVLATIVGVIFNFFTTGQLVFKNRSRARLIPFAATYGFVLALNLILLDFLIGAGVNGFAAQAIALPICVAFSYLINARIVFR